MFYSDLVTAIYRAEISNPILVTAAIDFVLILLFLSLYSGKGIVSFDLRKVALCIVALCIVDGGLYLLLEIRQYGSLLG